VEDKIGGEDRLPPAVHHGRDNIAMKMIDRGSLVGLSGAIRKDVETSPGLNAAPE